MAAKKKIEVRRSRKVAADSTLDELHQYLVNKHTFSIFVSGDPNATVGTDSDEHEPGVEYCMADRFERNLNFLSAIDPERPILVTLSTCGGYWDECMQMFGAILMCQNPITVLGTKWCRSASSMIPLAADRFVMRPPAKYMIHRGEYSVSGVDQGIAAHNRERLRDNELMLALYVARLREQGSMRRYSENRIRQTIDTRFKENVDWWLTCDEATHLGFADAVFDGDLTKLLAKKKNLKRRTRMLEVLRENVTITQPIVTRKKAVAGA